MITIEYLNQLKHIALGAQDRDGDGVYIDMLQALLPVLPPMVRAVVEEFLQDAEPNTMITMEDLNNDRPDYP